MRARARYLLLCGLAWIKYKLFIIFSFSISVARARARRIYREETKNDANEFIVGIVVVIRACLEFEWDITAAVVNCVKSDETECTNKVMCGGDAEMKSVWDPMLGFEVVVFYNIY